MIQWGANTGVARAARTRPLPTRNRPMPFAPNQAVSLPTYDVVCVPNVMLPLRDGVRLATDLYFPAHGCDRAAGTFPCILIRTPYDRAGSRGTGEYYARRGYVFASGTTEFSVG